MILKSLSNCILAIGKYPKFKYNATGGGGAASVIKQELNKSLFLRFDPEEFTIPPLNYETTEIFSIPMPPGLEIKMSLDKLEGTLDKSTGYIALEFESRFIFRIFSISFFPQLFVKTCLNSEEVNSQLHYAKGHNMKTDGNTTLVGVALIPRTGNKLYDLLLGLPNEALAILKCQFKD